MKQIIIILLFGILIFWHEKSFGQAKEAFIGSAKNIQREQLSGAFMQMNIKKEYPKKEFNLQDVADVEYIPLESRSDVLLDIRILYKMCISDSLIVTYDATEYTIFIFNRQGRILHAFNHRGRSGEEYLNIQRLTVDFKAKEVYIYDILNYKILVYDYDGVFKRVLKLPIGVILDLMCDYDSNQLLCYYIKGGGKKPYFFLSKHTGKIAPLDLSFQERKTNNLYYSTSPKGALNSNAQMISIPSYTAIKNGENFFIADWSCDTVYALSGVKLKPQIVKSPPVKEMNPFFLCYATLKTNRYTFLTSVKILPVSSNFRGRVESIDFMCDHNTGLVHQPSFVNKDYISDRNISIESMGMELPENCAVCVVPNSILLEDYQAGKIHGKLKEIVSKLNEDDNPIIMLIRFKK